MKVIPETRSVHLIWYLRFYFLDKFVTVKVYINPIFVICILIRFHTCGEREHTIITYDCTLFSACTYVFKECVGSWIRFRSGLTKGDTIGICCFSAKHAVLRSKYNEWLALNQNNMFEWSNTSTTDCCFSELAL